MKVEWYFLLLAILTATVMNHASAEVERSGIIGKIKKQLQFGHIVRKVK